MFPMQTRNIFYLYDRCYKLYCLGKIPQYKHDYSKYMASRTCVSQAWKDGSGGKVPHEHGDLSLISRTYFFLTEYDGIVRPALGKLGSLVVPWGSLACSPILLAKFQAIGSLVSKKKNVWFFEEGEPRLSSGFRMWPHAHIKPQHFKSCKSTACFGFHTVPFPVAQSASGFSYPRGNMWLVPAHSCFWDWGFENRFCSFKDFSLPQSIEGGKGNRDEMSSFLERYDCRAVVSVRLEHLTPEHGQSLLVYYVSSSQNTDSFLLCVFAICACRHVGTCCNDSETVPSVWH